MRFLIPKVFLINHDFSYDKLIPIVKSVRGYYPDLWIGVNFLGTAGDVAFPVLSRLERDEECRVDGYWADDACVDERNPYLQSTASAISQVKQECGWRGLYIGGKV